MAQRRRPVLFALLLTSAASAAPPRQGKEEDKPLPSIAKKTHGLRQLPGYFNLSWDPAKGILWLEIARFGEPFLYVDSLPAGMGSNDVGLDRGQLGESRVVSFERVGPKILLVQHNDRFRATSENPAEQRSVTDAFATSVLWGFTVAAQEGDRALVDATAFMLSDSHQVSAQLKRTGQGAFKLDEKRSAIYLPGTKSFPRNTEVEATLTFAGEEPGPFVKQVVPEPTAITLRERHSFIQLPGPGFEPRPADPRGGFFGPAVLDFGAPIGEPLERRFIARHRLQKSASGAPVAPLVYYVDPGVPEPIRSALLEGASWWAQAFEAAGFRNAFQVRVLPGGADPVDVRYNVIQWVHRATRGWSYGNAVIDPRSGEILKGQVTLGSQRIRQDYLIFEGLLSPWAKGKGEDPRMLAAALARIRQLAAHEVGHTLGLAHNFLASTHARASVMDYPHPLVKVAADGSLDLSDAYAVGIGDWDKLAIAWGYGEEPQPARTALLEGALAKGLGFLSDQDARPPGSAHPAAHLWDNGTDATAELARVLEVRARALEHFGEGAEREGLPLARLADVLVPVYLFHRYQTQAAAKIIGGQDYTYALRGDGQLPVRPIPPEAQRSALKMLLRTIAPETLALPERIVALLPPPPLGWERTRESFPSHTGPVFDPLGAAEVAARHSISLLLHRERAARLSAQSAPGLGEVIEALLDATWRAAPREGRASAVQRTVDDVALDELLSLARDARSSAEVRATALLALRGLSAWSARQAASAGDGDRRAHFSWAVEQVARLDLEPALKTPEPLDPPPGEPIGSFACGDDE